MPSGLRVTPPNYDEPPQFWPNWKFVISCPCGNNAMLQVSPAALRPPVTADHLAFEKLVGVGWSIEPPRCPECRRDYAG